MIRYAIGAPATRVHAAHQIYIINKHPSTEQQWPTSSTQQF